MKNFIDYTIHEDGFLEKHSNDEFFLQLFNEQISEIKYNLSYSSLKKALPYLNPEVTDKCINVFLNDSSFIEALKNNDYLFLDEIFSKKKFIPYDENSGYCSQYDFLNHALSSIDLSISDFELFFNVLKKHTHLKDIDLLLYAEGNNISNGICWLLNKHTIEEILNHNGEQVWLNGTVCDNILCTYTDILVNVLQGIGREDLINSKLLDSFIDELTRIVISHQYQDYDNDSSILDKRKIIDEQSSYLNLWDNKILRKCLKKALKPLLDNKSFNYENIVSEPLNDFEVDTEDNFLFSLGQSCHISYFDIKKNALCHDIVLSKILKALPEYRDKVPFLAFNDYKNIYQLNFEKILFISAIVHNINQLDNNQLITLIDSHLHDEKSKKTFKEAILIIEEDLSKDKILFTKQQYKELSQNHYKLEALILHSKFASPSKTIKIKI